MKKIIALFILCTIGHTAYSQKKNIKKTVPAAASTVLAKADNLTAELIKDNLYLFVSNKGTKDTILLKKFDRNTIPLNSKIAKFTSKGMPLYTVSWTEVNVNETKLKKEEATTVCTEICDIASKTKVLSNAQTNTKTSEIVFLDKNKTVSETQEKMRREGFEYIQLPDGDILLKNKTQENRMTYSPAEKKFVAKKK